VVGTIRDTSGRSQTIVMEYGVVETMHRDLAAPLVRRIGEQLADADIENPGDLDQIGDRTRDQAALQSLHERVEQTCAIGQILQLHAARFAQRADPRAEPSQGIVRHFHRAQPVVDLSLRQIKLLSKQ